jgi:hypothetical protein
MARLIKAAGVSLIAAIAVSAITAVAAPAATLQTQEGKTVTIFGEHLAGATHVFVLDGAKAECSVAKLTSVGSVYDGATELRLHPVYEKCTVFGFLNGTVTTTGCDYVLHATTTAITDTFTGRIQVVCDEGKVITFAGGTCEATVGEQTITSGISFIDDTATAPIKDDVTAKSSSAGIAFTKTRDDFGCPLLGKGVAAGTGNGNTTLTARNGGVQIDFAFE